MKMEQIECSETSAYKIQTPGNYPEENIQCTYIAYLFADSLLVFFLNNPSNFSIFSRVYKYDGSSISKLQIQVATYVFELSAGNCHR
jgi:hypothetical protein